MEAVTTPRSSISGTREGVLVDIMAEQSAAAAMMSGASFPQPAHTSHSRMPVANGISILDEPIENSNEGNSFIYSFFQYL